MELSELERDFKFFKQQEIEAHGQILEAMDAMRHEMREIHKGVTEAHGAVVNGGLSQRKEIRWADFFIIVMGILLAVIGWLYIDDREVSRASHREFSESLQDNTKNISQTTVALENLQRRIERDHVRYERNFDKLQPDRPRFDYKDHEDVHRQGADP